MRFKTIILSLAILMVPLLAGAQSFDDYLVKRKQNGITGPSDYQTVYSFVGEKIFELKGVVKGVVGSGESEVLMLAGPNGEQYFIRSQSTPDWLKNGSVAARFLVKITHQSETSQLETLLIAAASEGDVATYEAKNVRSGKSKPVMSGRIGGSKSSRAGRRPAPMPGDVPKATTNNVGETKPGLSAELAKALPAYVEFIKNRNKKLTDDEAQRIAQSILAYSAHFGVDARLIVAIIITESDFNPKTTSHAGAMGLGQLMPVNQKELGLTNAYDIEQNLWGTVKLVRGHIDKYNAKTDDSFEALVLALAGYNAGDGAVKKYGGVPPYKETQNYVRKVIAIYKELAGQ